MNPSEYRVGCERTVCDHSRALQRLQEISPNNPTFGLRLLHAAMGMSKESGEVQDLLEKAIFFNQELNVEKILDECGDILWYMSLALNTIGQSFEEVMRRNDAKLKARFPSKYADELAKNRDRAKEEKAQRGTSYPTYPCCMGVTRIEVKPGDATTLVGGHCPVHGYTYYKQGEYFCEHGWHLEKKFDDGTKIMTCRFCGNGKLEVPNTPKEVTEAEAHCYHTWRTTNFDYSENYTYCTKCELRKS